MFGRVALEDVVAMEGIDLVSSFLSTSDLFKLLNLNLFDIIRKNKNKTQVKARLGFFMQG